MMQLHIKIISRPSNFTLAHVCEFFFHFTSAKISTFHASLAIWQYNENHTLFRYDLCVQMCCGSAFCRIYLQFLMGAWKHGSKRTLRMGGNGEVSKKHVKSYVSSYLLLCRCSLLEKKNRVIAS